MGYTQVVILGCLILITTAAYEFIASSLWLPAYFRFGIPVFKKSFAIDPLPKLETYLTQLDTALNPPMPTLSLPGILEPFEERLAQAYQKEEEIELKALTSDAIAYRRIREKQKKKIHGRISINRETHQLEIIGYYRWMSPLFPLLLCLMLLFFPPGFIFGILVMAIPGGFTQRNVHKKISASIYSVIIEQQSSTEANKY